MPATLPPTSWVPPPGIELGTTAAEPGQQVDESAIDHVNDAEAQAAANGGPFGMTVLEPNR
ncbi:hypothetical protein ABIB82_004155 [Bradyrhizobium sp. i1.8.4]|uniref:hypothetical protein n=1 Tax=unclassified Bradyrhizobium TaxID=2631580 RepID=UPI003D203DDA